MMQHSNPLPSDIAQRSTFLRGIKDWIHGFWGYIMDQPYMPSEEAWHNCLHVTPPLMFTVMSIQAAPINSLAVPSLSLRVYQYNKLDMRSFNSGYLFPKRWNWQICHTHQAFKLPLWTFRSKLRTFLTVKSKIISSRSNPTVYSSSLCKNSSWVTSGKRAAKWPLCALFRASLHVLHYTVHVTPLCELWKLFKALGRTTSIVGLFPVRQFPLCQFPLRQFLFGQLPTDKVGSWRSGKKVYHF